MFTRWQMMLGAALVAMAMPVMTQAQGQGRGMMQGMGYDKAKETTVTGTVTDVTEQQGMGMGMGVHLALKAGNEALDVHLGPKAWLDEHGYTFAAGDELTIVGARTTMHDMATMTDKTALIAREIKKGDKTITLRDETGRPLWAGSMMRGR